MAAFSPSAPTCPPVAQQTNGHGDQEHAGRRLAQPRWRARQSPPMSTEPHEQPPEADVPGSPVDAAAAPTAAEPPTDTPAGSAAAPSGVSPAECGARLAALFPALFIAPGAPGPFKPIKLRIHADIQARAPGEFSKRVLGIFFSRYTTTNAYLKALAAPGAQRFDLDGQPAGEIAEEHRHAAVEELARRHAIAAERRAAQQPRRAAPAQRDDSAAVAGEDAAPPPRRQHKPEARRPPRGDEARREPRRRDGPDPRARSAPRPQQPPRRDDAVRPPSPPQQAPTPLPADPAQRERALLLRAFEASTISKANFCVLKRISEAELDAALARAREERR
jgi:sRNA-binding protein